jgi:hypothetical protein
LPVFAGHNCEPDDKDGHGRNVRRDPSITPEKFEEIGYAFLGRTDMNWIKMDKLKKFAAVVCGASFLSIGGPWTIGAQAAKGNDYPTVAIADYVFGCMASNDQSRQSLEKCSCSIDVIASILPYEQYVEAETIIRLRQVSGEKGTLFRTGAKMKEAFARLKRAQAEAEIRCF